jgi:hypothetical protein
MYFVQRLIMHVFTDDFAFQKSQIPTWEVYETLPPASMCGALYAGQYRWGARCPHGHHIQ